MKKGLIALLAVIVVIVMFGGMIIGRYNRLVQLDEDVNVAYSQIDNQLQRRNDLIPNLVETVKGFAAQEREIFESVTEARAQMMGAGTVASAAQANEALSGALSRLIAISENYPDLKSDANFRQLADELAGTENRIAVARRDYNTVVGDYNRTIRQFPMNFFASSFGFEAAAYFEASEGSREVPSVEFGN